MIIPENSTKKDEELAKLTIENQDYFSLLIKRYEQKLFRYIRKITNLADEEIEDILQDVFLKVYRNLNSFNPDLKFSSWIYRIAHNQVISNYRKITARPQTVSIDQNDVFLNTLMSELNTSNQTELEFLKKNINQILDRLDLKYREVLVLKYLEQKDYKEMSDILKKPVGTIGTLIRRAKDKFQQELSKSKINFNI